jgi:hypothetical protein
LFDGQFQIQPAILEERRKMFSVRLRGDHDSRISGYDRATDKAAQAIEKE